MLVHVLVHNWGVSLIRNGEMFASPDLVMQGEFLRETSRMIENHRDELVRSLPVDSNVGMAAIQHILKFMTMVNDPVLVSRMCRMIGDMIEFDLRG